MSRERCGVTFRRAFLRGLRASLEGVLEDEATAHVGAARYARARARRGDRNGHDPRDLVTRHGPLPQLRVPRLLEGGVEFTFVDKYQRRRTRPMRVFTNAGSPERTTYGVAEHLNANRQEHPLRHIQQNV